MDYIGIGQRIKLVRSSLGLSTTAAAKKIGYAQSHLSQVENGKSHPSARMLEAITSKLGISEHWLLTGEGEMNATAQPVVVAPPSPPISVDRILPKTTWRYRALEWLAARAGYRLVVPTAKVGPRIQYPGMSYEEALQSVRALSNALKAIGFNPFEDAKG